MPPYRRHRRWKRGVLSTRLSPDEVAVCRERDPQFTSETGAGDAVAVFEVTADEAHDDGVIHQVTADEVTTADEADTDGVIPQVTAGEVTAADEVTADEEVSASPEELLHRTRRRAAADAADTALAADEALAAEPCLPLREEDSEYEEDPAMVDACSNVPDYDSYSSYSDCVLMSDSDNGDDSEFSDHRPGPHPDSDNGDDSEFSDHRLGPVVPAAAFVAPALGPPGPHPDPGGVAVFDQAPFRVSVTVNISADVRWR